MNEQQAIAALKKLFGKNAAWRRNEKALVGEAREAALAEIPVLIEAAELAKIARDARRLELLKDPEYLRLCVEYNAADKARDRAVSHHHVRRVTVGVLQGAAGLRWFTIKGEGDNWAEAVEAARKAVKS